MIFLGLDLSGNSGYCVLEELGQGRDPRIEAGSWNCRADDFPGSCCVLADNLVRLVRDLGSRGKRIDLAGIEDVIRVPPTRTVRKSHGLFASEAVETQQATDPHTMLVQPALAGTAAAILHQYRIPSILVPAASWRKGFIGVGFAPKQITKGRASREWLKREVKAKAEIIGQRLGFTVTDTDMADAIGIAFHIAAKEGYFLGRLALGGGGRRL